MFEFRLVGVSSILWCRFRSFGSRRGAASDVASPRPSVISLICVFLNWEIRVEPVPCVGQFSAKHPRKVFGGHGH